MIKYTLIRSKRKTVAIYIRGGGVEVRAPLNLPKSYIDDFVLSKEKWLAKQLQAERERINRRVEFTLDYGALLTCRGKAYIIDKSQSKHIGVSDNSFYIPPNLTSEEIKAACVKIYKIIAKSDLAEKTFKFANQMSLKLNAVKINSAKTRWGSCSSKKNINFSWFLIMAEDDVIDYVVVHELAHLIHMNHSKRFWAVVESVLPDYRQRRKKLKEFQQKLNTENWD
ncbi:MAG: M48 family metallopeptidase [Oscillospiraceae bacterium]|nr:M48 family metallopeptidase [Oscillospiraceae bacterium]